MANRLHAFLMICMWMNSLGQPDNRVTFMAALYEE